MTVRGISAWLLAGHLVLLAGCSGHTGQMAGQGAATGAEVLVAPCHNCHSGLEDINHHYKLGMDIKFLGDILYQVMVRPASE